MNEDIGDYGNWLEARGNLSQLYKYLLQKIEELCWRGCVEDQIREGKRRAGLSKK